MLMVDASGGPAGAMPNWLQIDLHGHTDSALGVSCACAEAGGGIQRPQKTHVHRWPFGMAIHTGQSGGSWWYGLVTATNKQMDQ